MKFYFSGIIFLIGITFCTAQDFELQEIALKYAKLHLPKLVELLSISNDAHYDDQVEQNVLWCEETFPKYGFTIKRLDTGGPPLLIANRECINSKAKTVLVYLQMDGQPVDSSFWYQESPYKAVLKELSADGGFEIIPWEKLDEQWNNEYRVFARSSSDAKGPVSMFLAALDALKELNKIPNFHLKVILDFEEELGSPHLPSAVEKYREELSADMLIIFDGPQHISNRPTLSFGARGITTITLTVFGPTFPQHSGHYGNYVPNPAVRLSQLIASMKDEGGRVTIPGFYKGIFLDGEIKKILQAVPDDEQYLNTKLGIAASDSIAGTLQETLQFPSLNVRGLHSGWVGDEKRTIIPSNAVAEIDIRTVKESAPERLLGLVKDHILSKGYRILDHKPTQREQLKYDRLCMWEAKTSYQAFRTALDSELGLWLDNAITKAFGKPPIKIRTMGGSIPISPFVTTLKIPAVVVPTVNQDNNQHSPNENIRLGNYVDGIMTMIAILKEEL